MHRNDVPFSFSHFRRLATTLLLVLTIFATRRAASQTSADGAIHGHITDTSGALVSDVKITAHSPCRWRLLHGGL